MKIVIALFLLNFSYFSSMHAASKEKLNCFGVLEDGYQIGICQTSIDITKLHKIDCLGELEDEYQLGICKNAKDPHTARMIDCTRELEDGYQVMHCRGLDVNVQKYLNRIL